MALSSMQTAWDKHSTVSESKGVLSVLDFHAGAWFATRKPLGNSTAKAKGFLGNNFQM